MLATVTGAAACGRTAMVLAIGSAAVTVADAVVGVATVTVVVAAAGVVVAVADLTDTVCAETSAPLFSRSICVRASESDESPSRSALGVVAVSSWIASTGSPAPDPVDASALSALDVVAGASSVPLSAPSSVFCWADTVDVGPTEDSDGEDVDVDADDGGETSEDPVLVVAPPLASLSVVAAPVVLVDCVESVASGAAVATAWPAVTAAPSPTANAPTRSHCAQVPAGWRRYSQANVVPLGATRCERQSYQEQTAKY
ncbi:MAG TPA: hypothetical protein VJ777_00695 [Mycobacterium sp.]|nr:hypothetical protein [Mycobacterium sp.]